MAKIYEAPTLDGAAEALKKLVEKNETAGERTLVFCEDRLTLLAERTVISACGGSFLTEVSTFRRFLERRKKTQKILSKQGAVMEIAALLGEYKEQLGCFKRNAAQAVYETIAQLSASCVDADLLRRSAEETEGVLSRKLSDLALLFEKYEEFLKTRGMLDENGYLALLPASLTKEEIGGVHIVFFAYDAFTRQARECIRASARNARSVTGIFLGDGAPYCTHEAARAFAGVMQDLGMAFEHTMLPASDTGDARRIREGLFSVKGSHGEKAGGCSISFDEFGDEGEEMNNIAARIRMLTAQGKRFRDIAVLVGGESYFLAAAKAFAAYKIPYYADRKRSLLTHPFCGFTLAVLHAADSGVLYDQAEEIASSVYFGDGGKYRNYLMRYGTSRGAVSREIGETGEDRAELENARLRMLAILACIPRSGTGSAYAAGIRKLYETVEGERITEELAARLPAEDAPFLNITPLFEILDEIENVVGDRTFPAREFAVLLRSGLEARGVSVLPQHADAVFLGDATESRIKRVPVLFFAGLSEGLPRISQDTAVITDGEIVRLKDLSMEIEPAIAVVNARFREVFARNLASFSEHLYCSCPKQLSGSATTYSEAVYYLLRMFGQNTQMGSEKLPCAPDVYPYDCAEYAPALLRYFEMTEEAGESVRSASLKEVLARSPADAVGDPDALRAEKDALPPRASGKISPTELEEYFSCPYKCFANHVLGLGQKEERTPFGAMDAGKFVHAVLEETTRYFAGLKSEEECAARARQVAEKLMASPAFSALKATAAGNYTGKRLIGEATAVTVAAYRQVAGSDYRVKDRERKLRIDALGLEGKADRIDDAGGLLRIIDYKTGGIESGADAYYTGRKLQLELYLTAALEDKTLAQEGTRPGGVFYFPAADDFVKEGEKQYCMSGFYCTDPDVIVHMDTSRAARESTYFHAEKDLDHGMDGETFSYFLKYGLLVADGARREMQGGNIRPSPYKGVCTYCDLLGMCGFSGVPRSESGVTCTEIASIAGRPDRPAAKGKKGKKDKEECAHE